MSVFHPKLPCLLPTYCGHSQCRSDYSVSYRWLAVIMLFASSCSTRHDRVNLILQPAANSSYSVDDIVTAVARDADMTVSKKEVQPEKGSGAPVLVMRSLAALVVVTGPSTCTKKGAAIPCTPSSAYRALMIRPLPLPFNPKPMSLAQMFVKEANKRGWRAYVVPARAHI
jgi:hypothetical protein